MKLIRMSLLLCLAFVSTDSLLSQITEICNNAIDDDGDGLIDLNDDDCTCIVFSPSSLIPNPSFEDMTCCPTAEAQLTCAVDWIQASTPTTDYLHTCGITAHPFLNYQMPLPPPEGEGGIGFRDGKPGSTNFKEYTGACLTQAMSPGVSYMLDFFVGFHDEPGSMTFDMAVFATTDCDNIPFGGNDQNFGCPTNGPGWVQLGSMTFSGENEWVDAEFEFMADQAYTAIVLGPDCAINPNVNLDPYFFFDDLVLAESSSFGVPLMDVDGNLCEGTLTLTTSDDIAGDYQWYKDGVAIVGANNQSFLVPNTGDFEGVYEIVITNEDGCYNGEQYTVEAIEYFSTLDFTLCSGDTLEVGSMSLTETGTFDILLEAADGCDSTVTVFLTVLDGEPGGFTSINACEGEIVTIDDNQYSTSQIVEVSNLDSNGCETIDTYEINFEPTYSNEYEVFICEGAVFEFDGMTYSSSGIYEANFVSSGGCDSIEIVTLIVNEVITTNLEAEICEGDSFQFNEETLTEAGIYEQIMTTMEGCDSIILLDLEVLDVLSTDIMMTFCEGETATLNGESFTIDGVYTQTLESSNGCDSILTLNLSFLDNPQGQIDQSICDGEAVVINGESYSEMGEFEQSLIATNGCDSTLFVSISILNPTRDSLSFSLCSGENIEVNGEVFNAEGFYNQTLVNSVGCDSILSIDVSLLPTYNVDDQAILCLNDTLIYNGDVFLDGGDFIQTLQASNGCDSIVNLFVEVDDNCADCKVLESVLTLKMIVEKIGLNNFNVLFDYDEDVTSFEHLTRSQLLDIIHVYTIENDRLHKHSTIANSILFNKWDYLNRTPSPLKNEISKVNKNDLAYFIPNVKGEILNTLDIDYINYMFNYISTGVDNLKIGNKSAFE